MVNTFLVHPDFRRSAGQLDRQRLGKQRVEAYQILIVLQHYRYLADFFNIPQYPSDCDTPKEQRAAWISHVVGTFKRSGMVALHVRGNTIIQYHSGQTLPHRPASGNKLVANGEIVYELKGKRQEIVWSGHWSLCLLPGEELITTKIRTQSMIVMWLGFDTALKAYIDAHIDEWVARGYQNNMKRYNVKDCVRPSWTFSEELFRNHKSALIHKEVERREPPWYAHKDDFRALWTGQFEGYIWP